MRTIRIVLDVVIGDDDERTSMEIGDLIVGATMDAAQNQEKEWNNLYVTLIDSNSRGGL